MIMLNLCLFKMRMVSNFKRKVSPSRAFFLEIDLEMLQFECVITCIVENCSNTAQLELRNE